MKGGLVDPVLFIVDHRKDVLETLASDLRHRFGMDYDIRTGASAEDGLSELESLADDGATVALVIVAEELPDGGGLGLLEQAHRLHPEARRILIVDRGRWTSGEAIVRAMTLGRLEGILFTPWALLEQYLYPTIGDHLSDWAKERPPGYEAARIVGNPGDPSVHELQQTLFTIGVPFGFYPDDSDEGRRHLADAGLQDAELPVVLWWESGRILTKPTHAELARSLGLRTEPATDRCDVVIIGAGPAGLAASVYAASEGLDTMVVERTIPGGQAASSALIRNYLGFARGISGDGLALRAFEQAWLFGADFVMTQPATALRVEGDDRVTVVADGTEVRSPAVVVTTGVTWRRLDAPGIDDLLGSGVFYGASQSEARGLRGEDVFVIGGGNSAGQAVVHLARHARQVTLLVRGPSLSASMSDYLIREIDDASNIRVRFRTRVVGAGGAGQLQELTLRDAERELDETVPASALFIMIGADPHTDWLPTEVARDERGFVRTGPAVIQAAAAGTTRWPLERPPFPTETSVPGVFAAGDVVAGSTKRVASAVGGGAMAIESVHRYLATLQP
jgi:thioredoxin reductase (NADPH)